MIANWANQTGRMWYSTSDPDNNVNNGGSEFTIYANAGNFFFNTSSKTLFFCTQEGQNNQIWETMAFV
jgi:hypothetical protein